jgi:hypothetical protein
LSFANEMTMPPSTYTETSEMPTMIKTQPPDKERGGSLNGIIGGEGEGENDAVGVGLSVPEGENEIVDDAEGTKSEQAYAVANNSV